MLTKERQQQILSYLSQHNTVTVQELSARLYASASTIRRDLSELEEQGILKRVHGGAVLTAGSTFDTPAQLRKTQQLAEKVKIAELASRFLRPSSTYFFRFQLDERRSRLVPDEVPGREDRNERGGYNREYEQFAQAFHTFMRRLPALAVGRADGQHCDKKHRGDVCGRVLFLLRGLHAGAGGDGVQR